MGSMKKRVILILSSLLVLVYLGWALSPLWKSVVYGKAPKLGCETWMFAYSPLPSALEGEVASSLGAFELSDDCQIGYTYTPSSEVGKDVQVRFAFDLPRYGNEQEVKMQILPGSEIVGAIAWDDKPEVNAALYGESGLTPRAWAESQGLGWLELIDGDTWTFSIPDKKVHQILLVCEVSLKPDAPAGMQPYVLLGVKILPMDDLTQKHRRLIPRGLQLQSESGGT